MVSNAEGGKNTLFEEKLKTCMENPMVRGT
jgi:hypothetical protein